jgi:hypothetical protein
MKKVFITLFIFTSLILPAHSQQVVSKEASSKIGSFFDSPQGILIVSGVAAVYSGMLYSAAAKQEQESDDNIKKIDKIIAEFKDSYIAFCPDGREDLNKPECYCYLATGAQNTTRTNSQICQTLWSKNTYKITTTTGDYNGLGTFVDPVGCLNMNGQFDENCNCKKLIDSKGANACQKSVSITIPNSIASAVLSNTGLKDVMQVSANSTNGNPLLGNFNVNSLGAKAIATENVKKQLLSKIATGSNTPALSLVNSGNVGKYASAMIGDRNIAAAAANSRSAMDMSSSPMDPNAASLLKAAASKAGIDLVGSGRGMSAKKADAKDGFSLNLNGDGSAGGNQNPNFPETQKNYKINDISKKADTSIFEIISNRYIQSGLRRLFDN